MEKIKFQVRDDEIVITCPGDTTVEEAGRFMEALEKGFGLDVYKVKWEIEPEPDYIGFGEQIF